MIKESNPRHPPRAIPLGLRVPIVGGGIYKERLKFGEMSRSQIKMLASGWGEDAPLPSGYA